MTWGVSKKFLELLERSSLGSHSLKPRRQCAACGGLGRKRSRCQICSRLICVFCQDPTHMYAFCNDQDSCKAAKR